MDSTNVRVRMFEKGEFKLIILGLLAEKSCHGYEIIQLIKEMSGGEYIPSSGVVYPTLSVLEERGYVTTTKDNKEKKQYVLTQAGRHLVQDKSEALSRVKKRVTSIGLISSVRKTPEMQRAIQNFKTALHLRLTRSSLTTNDLQEIAAVLDEAAVKVERT